jgi:hypothetical protein
MVRIDMSNCTAAGLTMFKSTDFDIKNVDKLVQLVNAMREQNKPRVIEEGK